MAEKLSLAFSSSVPITLVPDQFKSEQQFIRYYHQDIPELSDLQIEKEMRHILPRLWGLPDDHWLNERIMKLREELKQRSNIKYAQVKKETSIITSRIGESEIKLKGLDWE